REARRPADPTIDEVRAGDQRQHSEGAWTRNFANAARPRRPGDRVRRREFITLLGGAAAWPVAARGQQGISTARRIAFLLPGGSRTTAVRGVLEAFRQGLKEHGWVEGQNISVDYRFAEGKEDALTGIAAEFVRSRPDVLVVEGTTATRAAKTATQTVPI